MPMANTGIARESPCVAPSDDELSVPSSTNRRDGTYSKPVPDVNSHRVKALSASTRSSASVASLSKMSLIAHRSNTTILPFSTRTSVSILLIFRAKVANAPLK